MIKTSIKIGALAVLCGLCGCLSAPQVEEVAPVAEPAKTVEVEIIPETPKPEIAEVDLYEQNYQINDPARLAAMAILQKAVVLVSNPEQPTLPEQSLTFLAESCRQNQDGGRVFLQLYRQSEFAAGRLYALMGLYEFDRAFYERTLKLAAAGKKADPRAVDEVLDLVLFKDGRPNTVAVKYSGMVRQIETTGKALAAFGSAQVPAKLDGKAVLTAEALQKAQARYTLYNARFLVSNKVAAPDVNCEVSKAFSYLYYQEPPEFWIANIKNKARNLVFTAYGFIALAQGDQAQFKLLQNLVKDKLALDVGFYQDGQLEKLSLERLLRKLELNPRHAKVYLHKPPEPSGP